MSAHIALDVGGTRLRAACYRSDSLEPVKIEKTPTQGGDRHVLEKLADMVRKIWPEDEEVEAIGIAAPGPTNPFKGIVYTAPNILGWDDLPITRWFEERFHVPVLVGNDANLAALGEWRYGAGRGHHHLLYMTISTGIGSGIIANNQLLLGVRGLAAELGHVTVDPDGPVCGCGQKGHLEAFASGPAIVLWVEQELANGIPSALAESQTLSAKAISKAAHAGDRLALKALQRAGMYIGMAVVDFVHMFNPSIIIIGGGVSQSGDLIMDPIRACLRDRVISSHYLDDLTLTNPAFGDDAGLIGALALARSHAED